MAQTSALPAPIESESLAPTPATTTTLGAPQTLGLDLGTKKVDSRDALIGVAVLVVLAILFFVIKNAYANWRVRERVAPSRANGRGVPLAGRFSVWPRMSLAKPPGRWRRHHPMVRCTAAQGTVPS